MSHAAIHDKGGKYEIKKEQTDDGHWEMRVPNWKCADLWEELEPIEFKLEAVVIVIQPRGYTYQSDPDQNYC
jgi:hypothetical protein